MAEIKEQYVVSARKYRPGTFHSVVGQDSLTNTLKNAIKNQHLAHAYLFCGPRGVGKTTCARIFAKTINCNHLTAEGEACNECESCVSFNQGRSLNIFEMDAASNNSVDDIRELVRQVMVPPQIGRYRVYIIDEVHMLSQAAFNAFLKTLEEPPEYAIFILATTEKHKILPTIISRCQVYDFNRIQISDTVNYLKYIAQNEGVAAEEEALKVIAEKSDGAMRDALSIFDQILSYAGGREVKYSDVIEVLNVLDYEYYFKLVDWFVEGNIVDSLLCLDTIINKGFDLQHFISGLSNHLRDLLVAKDKRSAALLDVSDTVRQRYEVQASGVEAGFIFRALSLASECELAYKASQNKRLLVEIALMKMCQIITPLAEPEPRVQLKQVEAVAENRPTANRTSEPKPATQPEQATKPVATEQPAAASASKQPEPQKPAKEEPTAVAPQKTLNLKRFFGKETEQPAAKTAAEEVAEVIGEAAEEKIAVEDSQEAQNKCFTQEELVEAWRRYASEFADKFAANYIESINPQKDGNQCVIGVVNDHQEKFFTENKSKIEGYLAEKLRKPDIELKIEREEVAIERTLSPDDTLREMIEENAHLQRLIDELDLELRY